MNVPISAERVRALLGATSARNAPAKRLRGDPLQSTPLRDINICGPIATRISDDTVREIRRLSKRGEKGKDIASKFGISNAMVSQILTGARKAYVQ